MAKEENEAELTVVAEEEEEEGEEREKWVKHYCSSHQILLVGEGDFSFSLSLAQSFGSASNILASSLDSYDTLIKNYKQAKSNLEKLELLGASLLHGVDATKMKFDADLSMRKFDRIIYNFPHAGFHGKEDGNHLIKMHRNLVYGFFKNASGMLRPDGEIHVNHKTTAPFNHWNLEELASQNSLAVTELVDFKIEDYPGYNNKRGAGVRCDEPFPLGECCTYKFRFSRNIKKMPKVLSHLDMAHTRFQHHQEAPYQTLQLPIVPCEFRRPLTNFTAYANEIHGYGEPPLAVSIRNDCSRIFQGYFSHVVETFGTTDYDVSHSVYKALKLGYATYMAEVPGRDLSGYINVLQELRRLSVSRLEWLRNMLLGLDHQF